jgi:hypothetical protein
MLIEFRSAAKGLKKQRPATVQVQAFAVRQTDF